MYVATYVATAVGVSNICNFMMQRLFVLCAICGIIGYNALVFWLHFRFYLQREIRYTNWRWYYVHIVMTPPLSQVTSWEPVGLHEHASVTALYLLEWIIKETYPWCIGFRTVTVLPELASQTHNFPSVEPAATKWPSGLKDAVFQFTPFL